LPPRSITSSFVERGLILLPAALAVMLGAGVMAVVFPFSLSWLSPLCIFVGVLLLVTRQDPQWGGDVGQVLIGLGMIPLALLLVNQSTASRTSNAAVQLMLASLTSHRLLEIGLGAALAVLVYSSLAVVLLPAALATYCSGPLKFEEIELSPRAVGVEITDDFTGPDR